ncbi:MAG TPA: HEXXH motif-containing putative peptide modification protein [Polyangium sp.]|nr:HEXXH motif-containing putative peptide modification protein [Polyangium sp.]
MADISSHADIFASPVHGDAVGAVRSLAAGRLNATRRRVADVLSRAGKDEAARALVAFTPGRGSAWRPEMGLALLALRNDAPALAALQLAALHGGMGGSGVVEVDIDTPQWLYLDGWLEPIQGACRLAAGENKTTLHSDLGHATYVLSPEKNLVPAEAPGGPWRVFPSGGLAPRYVTVSGLRHSVEGFPWIEGPPPAPPATVTAPQERIDVIRAAWRLLLESAPLFAPWVASTAAGCLLLDRSGSHEAQSGSSYDHPGLIAIETPDDTAFCGELLVHECAHQHMLLYSMVAPFVQTGSDEVYYSPIKRAHRPIERVLSGAHAVGNMIVYYHALRRTTGLDAAAQDRFSVHQRWFDEDYRPALDQSKTLTETGQRFWRGVCNAVDSAARQ